MRAFLKTIFPRKLFPFLRSIDKYVINTTYCYLAIKRFLRRDKVKRVQSIFQSIPVFHTKILFDSSVDAELTAFLDDQNISYKSGRHSVYISERSDLKKINRELVGRNLPPYGLKIFKSRELSPDGTPYYTSKILAPASTYCSMKAVGNVSEKVVVSNLLHTEGVAPRVYDLVILEGENEVRYHAYIVQHVAGSVVHGEEGSNFLSQFKLKCKKFGISVISISEHCDLRPPDFRDNIMNAGDNNYYVDIQNFTVTDQRKVQRVREKIVEKYRNDTFSEIFFDKTIPPLSKSSEKVVKFQRRLQRIFKKGDIIPGNYIFIDGCQGLGAGLSFVLALGGKWGFLLRSEPECLDLRQFHYLRGYTRFDCVHSVQELNNLIHNYNYRQQDICLICDSISSDIQEISLRDSCKFLVMIGSAKMAGDNREILYSGDTQFKLIEQCIDEFSEKKLALFLYQREND